MSSGTCSLPILDSDLFCSTSVEGIKIISANSFQQEKCITKNAESEMKTKQKGISRAQAKVTIKNYFAQDFIETNDSINSINQQNQLISSQRKSFKLENYKDTNDSIAHMSMISTTHVSSVSKKHRRNSFSLDQLNGNVYLKERKHKCKKKRNKEFMHSLILNSPLISFFVSLVSLNDESSRSNMNFFRLNSLVNSLVSNRRTAF